MRRSPRQQILLLLSFLVAAVPVAFGAIRAIETGSDFRYLWMAIATLIAATAVIVIRKARIQPQNVPGALSPAVFGVTTVIGVLTAYLLGARSVPGIVMVSVAYALCWTASYALHTLSRPRTA